MNEMIVTLTGPATILGYGNGDPGFKEIERPVNGETSFRIKSFFWKGTGNNPFAGRKERKCPIGSFWNGIEKSNSTIYNRLIS